MPLDRLRLFNRCDYFCRERLPVGYCFLSDGESWEKVYEHDGSVFYGYSDGKAIGREFAGR